MNNYNTQLDIWMGSSSKEIDLVNLGSVSAYLFKNDYTYKIIPENLRNYNLKEHNKKLTELQNESNIIWNEPFFNTTVNILKKIIDKHWETDNDFSLIDVGCNYGLVSLAIADYIKSKNKSNKIFAFDCGLASFLCKKNIKLNQFDNIIRFEKKAVCDSTSTQKVFFDDQHTEDNHIVERKGINLPSYEVDGISLDKYFQDSTEDFIIKIDTQGAEPLVFDGMKKILYEKLPIILFEFTPWAYEIICEPMEFFKKIPKGYSIFNIDDKKKRLELIDENHVQNFVSKVSKSTPYWTDLLIIHKSKNYYDKLLNDLNDLFGNERD